MSSPITRSARGQSCTLQIAQICNYDNETTVFAHFPIGDGGSNKLNGDLCGGFCCSSCHDILDGRVIHDISQEDLEFYMRRSQFKTIYKLHDMGLIKVMGRD